MVVPQLGCPSLDRRGREPLSKHRALGRLNGFKLGGGFRGVAILSGEFGRLGFRLVVFLVGGGSFQGRQVWAFSVARRSRGGDLVEEAGDEAFGKHELRQDGQLHIITETARFGRLLTQDKGVQEALDLTRVFARSRLSNLKGRAGASFRQSARPRRDILPQAVGGVMKQLMVMVLRLKSM